MPKKSKRKKQSGKVPSPKKTGQSRKLKSAKKPVAKSAEKHPIDPRQYPFIHPEIIKISKDFISTYTDKQRNEIPGPLHPFLQKMDLSTLIEALKRNSTLYFDPIVSLQISYLMDLRNNQDLWNQLGWGIQADESFPAGWGPPKEVDEVEKYLRLLLEAHAYSIFRNDRIEWKPLHKKPGPPGGLRNPHPTADPWTDSIKPKQLLDSFNELHKTIKEKIDFKAIKRNPSQAVINRISKSAMEALQASDIDWSGLKKTIYDGPAFDPKKPEPTDPKQRRAILFFWLMRSKDKWEPLDLNDPIKKMCSGNMGNAGTDGKPSYLGYTILGFLLDVPPEKIRDVIENYRHKRPSRKKRTS